MKERIDRLLNSRFRISTQLYFAIGGAVLLTMAASLVGWFSFDRVGDAQSHVNDNSIPEMAAAFEVAEYSSVLVAAAPSLTSAPTRKDLETVYDGISNAIQALELQLQILEQSHTDDEHLKKIRTHSQTIVTNVDDIRSQRTELFRLVTQKENLRVELADLRNQLDDTVVAAIDDQLFYINTGYRNLGDHPANFAVHFTEEEFRRYRHLSELQSDANIATELLANAFTLSEAATIEPLRERFEAVDGRIQRNLNALEGSETYLQIAPVFARLSEMGIGEQNGFTLLESELRLNESQRLLLAQNQDEAVALVAQVDGLVVSARDSADQATTASTQAILTGRTLLLAISALSVGGAFLIAWLFVGRVLLRRIQMLSDWMRRMASGDLQARVEIGGNDEVADMAAALEVFRQHALEVQRLNLVELLAADLQERNEELQSVLEELRLAQDKIITQQKLAEMGELTAGVAHEIRNPLNFVKNFSEVSEELIDELKELLDEIGDGLTDEQRDYIDEIAQDITGNLERIRHHGARANRIVEDMLQLGRGGGEVRSVMINDLLNEHALLAFHSARALDPDFQLDLRPEFDPDAGEWPVIPEDMGRVFLNMVSNACHATDDKRRTLIEKGESGSYMPTLWLRTKRTEDAMEIRIRDNGDGIPDDVIDKIFNPFFTTKPTDKGTGLGLALSNDIVREHGGTINPVSVPGEYTEMVVVLPVDGIREEEEAAV